MTRKPEIRISTDGVFTEVYVNGKKLEGVVGVRFSSDAKQKERTILQIDLKATNVELNAKMLPALPEPFSGFYIPFVELLNSELVPKDVAEALCREHGFELDAG